MMLVAREQMEIVGLVNQIQANHSLVGFTEIMATCTTKAHIEEMTAGSYWLLGFCLL
jgi:hypothetical protein